MPGLCQLLTGLILFVGPSWFQVFTADRSLYMAALSIRAVFARRSGGERR